MARFCFTGNPFVDAGIAGMCAAAGAERLQDLDEAAVGRAITELRRIMTSESTFKKRTIGKKETAFATSEMTVIFPNGPLCQASYSTVTRKCEAYEKRISGKEEAFEKLVSGQGGETGYGVCFVDGTSAVMRVGNDEFPLVDSKSKRNFHPGLQEGHSVGPLTALSLEFFPFSVLRTGVNSGFFWFVHTAVEKIAVACAKLTIDAMNRAIARNEGLGFFGDWRIRTTAPDAALVALIRDLMTGAKLRALSWSEINKGLFPVTAYIFSNDNRGPSIEAHDLPHQLFWFFQVLNQHQEAIGRFDREVLQNDKSGWLAAKRMLLRESIISLCSIRPDGEKAGQLRGGWQAHSDYAREVLEMNSTLIRDFEAVSERITQSEDAKPLVLMLQKEGPSAAFLRLSRLELMTFDEYVRLAPPDDRRAAFTSRDYLLAAIYERQARGEEFLIWDGVSSAEAGNQHPLIRLTEHVGAALAKDADIGKQVASNLAKAKRLPDLRVALLRVVRRGTLTWRDFVDVFPPDKTWVSFLLRDYLLAYLYTALRDVELPEAETITDKAEASDD